MSSPIVQSLYDFPRFLFGYAKAMAFEYQGRIYVAKKMGNRYYAVPHSMCSNKARFIDVPFEPITKVSKPVSLDQAKYLVEKMK